MRIQKVWQRRIHKQRYGVELIRDANAVVAGNVGGCGSSTARVSSTQRVQRETKSTPPQRKED